MRSDIDYDLKTYGGYIFENFTVDVDYVDFNWDAGDNIDFDEHQEFAKNLENILFGQVSPVDIKTKTYSWKRTFKRIIFKGEQITKLNLKAMKEHWDDIDFSRTPWAKKIKELKHSYMRKVLRREIKQKKVDIKISFDYIDGGVSQPKSGSFIVSPQVAKWLGEQLVKASQGELEINGSKIKVKGDTNISPVK